MNNNVPKLVLAISFYLFSPFFKLSLSAQNWQQVTKVVASDRTISDLFGRSVAISGDYAVVGTIKSTQGYAGSAYIFKRNGTTWTQEAKIVASDRGTGDNFGSSVAINGDYVVIGAYQDGEDTGGFNGMINAGSVYIFKRNGTDWTQEAKIVALDRHEGDAFGISVSISGDYVVVGAFGKSTNTSVSSGSAYIFKRNGTMWAQEAKIVASDLISNDNFGISVSISGDYAVVGARYEDEDASGGNPIGQAGSAYIFKRNGTTWTQEAKIVASDRGAEDYFGSNVAIDGDYIVVSTPLEDEDANGNNTLISSGSAYIFKRNGTTWTQEAKIVASDRSAGDNFGISVSISGDYIIVGANAESEDAIGGNTLGDAGSAYIFTRSLIVPVELTDFKGRNTEGGNLLTWTTVSEINSHHFDIERSSDGQRWSKLGFLGAKNKPSDYQYIDQNPILNEVNYYRLCSVDIDGKKEFSKIVSVKMNEVRSPIKIYPSVTEGVIQIETALNIQQVWVSNASGQIVLTSTQSSLNLGSFPTGVYVVTVKGGDSIFSETVFKQ